MHICGCQNHIFVGRKYERKTYVCELKNLIVSSTNNDAPNRNETSFNSMLEKITTFEMNTQNSIEISRSEIAKLQYESDMRERKRNDQNQIELLNGLVISGF